MTATDLHIACYTEIQRRERVALSARGPILGMTDEARAYWDIHDSADALRRYAADRERLDEHHPCDDDKDDPCGAHSSRYECCPCHSPRPCPQQWRIAASLGIPTGGDNHADHR